MTNAIDEERADSDAARSLVDELETELAAIYPDESRHGYAIERLLARGVRFFVVRLDGEPVACGGVEIAGDRAELKRMFVRRSHRGRGLSRALIDRLEAVARASGARVLRLETGIHQSEAIGLYVRSGFRKVAPFPPYFDDPLSVCMAKDLVSERAP
jgi:GNAT superfamily N-acetyltransferase